MIGLLCVVLWAPTPLRADGGAPGGDVAPEWTDTVSRVAASVVALKIARLRSFDDREQGSSTATGFVVDAERGIVLTNRHVVGSGPIRAAATFQNSEQVDAVPLYRDPVHDFAFLRYDPAALEEARPKSLVLRPDLLKLGLEVRVIGSDGGEQLSILSGTIARLNRDAPSYGRYGYNDYNTFYIQAASSTSGGSSGSPVIDRRGRVVALNAAANPRTASSFFLPLPRVIHALHRLQAGRTVPRGGLETVFESRTLRDLRRLGLDTAPREGPDEGERYADGRLVVSRVIPGGTADGVLQEGDILLRIDGVTVADFLDLESRLDRRIGDTIRLELLRQGEIIRREVEVSDLHRLEPDRLLELGDAALQDMSLQHARAMNRPRGGVVLERPGFYFERAGVPRGSVIVGLEARPIETLDDLIEAVRGVPQGELLALRYIVPGDEFSTRLAQLELDDRWFGHRLCERRDDTRFWRCRDLALDRPPPAEVGGAATLSAPADYDDPLLDRVAPALVDVHFDIPYPADNVYAEHFRGVGLIVDAARGLVAVDRNTVPIGLGDARITLFSAREVDASVVFLHPKHNLALLAFDPAVLEAHALEPPPLVEAAPPPDDAALALVLLRDDGTLGRHPVTTPSLETMRFAEPGLPRFQQLPVDVYDLDDVPSSQGGVLADASGAIHALYASFAHEREQQMVQTLRAIPARLIREMLQAYRSGTPWRALDAVLDYRSISEARRLGLPDAWLERLRRRPADQRRVLYVERSVPAMPGVAPPVRQRAIRTVAGVEGPEAADVSGMTADADAPERDIGHLQPGDVLLAIDGEPVTDLFELERRVQRETLTLTVLRARTIRRLEVAPTPFGGVGTDRVVMWAGALLQMPHPEIAAQKGVEFPGVYIGWTDDGSVANWDGLYRNRFITAINGEPVRTLDEFLDRVDALDAGKIARLSLTSLGGYRDIVAVEPEPTFWPTFELRRERQGWRRVNHDK